MKDKNVFGEKRGSQKTLSSQQKSILKDPFLDSEDAIIGAVHLISFSGLEKANPGDKELAKKIKSDSYFCEKLTKFHNSPSDSAAGKVRQVFINHGGIPLDKYYKHLENIQKAPADTDLGKVRQASENNEFLLTNEINKLNNKMKSKSAELKQKIGKQFTIRYGKIDKEEKIWLTFNENNRELEIKEV